MDREGTLKIHVSGSIAMNDWAKDRVTDPEPLVATADEYRTSHFDPIGRKWWGDGTPLTKTSVMVGEYADGGHGTMGVDETDFDRMIAEARKGALVRVHAMGDGSVRAILDVFERARKLSPGTLSQTHQISHCLFLRDEDIPRFRSLNVVADFSPVIYYRSPQMNVLEEVVGAGNIKYLANIKKSIDGGVQVAIGSDWPTGAIDANPLRMLQVLVTRKDPYVKNSDEPLGDPISLKDAIHAMTMGGAYSMRKENELGSIEKGKAADMVVLSRNLFETDAGSIIDTKVVYTIFGGSIVYDAGVGLPPQ
jgi:hypothetical protein